MTTQIREHLHPYMTGAAGYFHLWQHVKGAAKDQSIVMRFIDPIQGRVSHAIQKQVESGFDTYIAEAPSYHKLKQKTVERLFPSTEIFIERLQKGEQVSENIENRIDRFSKKSRLVRLTMIFGATLLFGGLVSQYIYNPVKIFWITGIFLSVMGNYHAIAHLAKDTKHLCNASAMMLQGSLEARSLAIKTGRSLVKSGYPDPSKAKRVDLMHCQNLIRAISTYFFGPKAESLKTVEETINSQICEPIKEFEKAQRNYYFSKATNASLKKLTAVTISQLTRLFLTNLTGLGLTAIAFYATYSFIHIPGDHCTLYTPLHNVWNHLFPFSYFPFSETCTRYRYFLYAADTIKWGLRFFIWNKMVQVWMQNRENAVDNMMRPISDWTKKTRNDVISSLKSTSELVQNFVLEPLKLQGTQTPDQSPRPTRVQRTRRRVYTSAY